jgi:hypothetical protein
VSVIEVLVSTALVAAVSGALLPAIAIAARLQRESAIEVEAALIAARRLAIVKAGIGAGVVAGGVEHLDRSGAPAASGAAAYECSWAIEPSPGPPGLLRVTVSVAAIGAVNGVTVTSVVPDG